MGSQDYSDEELKLMNKLHQDIFKEMKAINPNLSNNYNDWSDEDNKLFNEISSKSEYQERYNKIEEHRSRREQKEKEKLDKDYSAENYQKPKQNNKSKKQKLNVVTDFSIEIIAEKKHYTLKEDKIFLLIKKQGLKKVKLNLGISECQYDLSNSDLEFSSNEKRISLKNNSNSYQDEIKIFAEYANKFRSKKSYHDEELKKTIKNLVLKASGNSDPGENWIEFEPNTFNLGSSYKDVNLKLRSGPVFNRNNHSILNNTQNTLINVYSVKYKDENHLSIDMELLSNRNLGNQRGKLSIGGIEYNYKLNVVDSKEEPEIYSINPDKGYRGSNFNIKIKGKNLESVRTLNLVFEGRNEVINIKKNSSKDDEIVGRISIPNEALLGNYKIQYYYGSSNQEKLSGDLFEVISAHPSKCVSLVIIPDTNFFKNGGGDLHIVKQGDVPGFIAIKKTSQQVVDSLMYDKSLLELIGKSKYSSDGGVIGTFKILKSGTAKFYVTDDDCTHEGELVIGDKPSNDNQVKITPDVFTKPKLNNEKDNVTINLISGPNFDLKNISSNRGIYFENDTHTIFEIPNMLTKNNIISKVTINKESRIGKQNEIIIGGIKYKCDFEIKKENKPDKRIPKIEIKKVESLFSKLIKGKKGILNVDKNGRVIKQNNKKEPITYVPFRILIFKAKGLGKETPVKLYPICINQNTNKISNIFPMSLHYKNHGKIFDKDLTGSSEYLRKSFKEIYLKINFIRNHSPISIKEGQYNFGIVAIDANENTNNLSLEELYSKRDFINHGFDSYPLLFKKIDLVGIYATLNEEEADAIQDINYFENSLKSEIKELSNLNNDIDNLFSNLKTSDSKRFAIDRMLNEDLKEFDNFKKKLKEYNKKLSTKKIIDKIHDVELERIKFFSDHTEIKANSKVYSVIQARQNILSKAMVWWSELEKSKKNLFLDKKLSDLHKILKEHNNGNLESRASADKVNEELNKFENEIKQYKTNLILLINKLVELEKYDARIYEHYNNK